MLYVSEERLNEFIHHHKKAIELLSTVTEQLLHLELMLHTIIESKNAVDNNKNPQ